jgi:hypothetical protein
MDIVTRKAQILQVQTQNPCPELNEVPQENLNTEVLGVTQSVLEAALYEEYTLGHRSSSKMALTSALLNGSPNPCYISCPALS